MEKDMEQTPEETEAGKEPCQEADQETASKAETSETAEGERTSEKDAEDQPEKKGFFGKKKEKKDKKDQQIEELTDRVKRQMAEFDNYRKRTDKEQAAMFEVGAKSVIEKVLPVVDNFERGLAAVPEDQKGSPFAEGMEKIYKQLMTVLEELEVKPIEALGKEFDPNLHNAVMHIEDEELGENVIAEEFQKGYTYHDMVVRHSMVGVVQ